MKIEEVRRETEENSDLAEEFRIIQVRIRRTLSLPIDNLGEPSGAESDLNLYPPIKMRELTPEDLIPKPCVKKQIFTGDPIIDSLPIDDE